MMKRSAIALAVIPLLIGDGVSQSKPEKRSSELVGPVRSVLIEETPLPSGGGRAEGPRKPLSTRIYDEKGNLMQLISYKGDGVVSGREVSSYDAEGRERESVKYNEQGAVERKSIYKYDASGKRIERENYNKEDALTSRSTYNSSGKVAETFRFDEDAQESRTVYDYNADGKKTEQRGYKKDGSLISRTVYKHDEASKRFEKLRHKGGDSLESRVERTISPDDSSAEVSYYASDGSKVWSWSFTYDEQGVLMSDEFRNKRGTLRNEYSFEFDQKGNWIKRTILRKVAKEGAEPGSVVYRTISYHPGSGSIKKDEATEETPLPFTEGVMQGEAIKRATPMFPREARRSYQTGKVVIEVTIDETGRVEKARAISGSSVFYSSAIAAAKEWEFRPTLSGGLPVKVIGTVTFNFTP